MKRIALLGATGSIGRQTLDVIRLHPEQFQLVSMSVGRNIELARKIIQEFSPKLVSVLRKEDKEALKLEFTTVNFVYGEEGLIEAAIYPDIDVVVTAVVGSVGLLPTLEAIKMERIIALANKETLVTAGHIVMEEAQKHNVPILPVDSEHSAIFQCLQGEQRQAVDNIILTASGGSFRDKRRDELKDVTVSQALNHPNWSMGAKITIDSATMMNKGLEVIEAHWLFDMPYENINVVLHKESIVHSMVEFKDMSVIAQLGTPDMRVPIQYALTYPKRLELPQSKRLNLWEVGTLHFDRMDLERYRCMEMAFEAGKQGGTMTTVLNAANEEAVEAFLNGKITFLQIEELIEQALEAHDAIQNPCLNTIREVDTNSRDFVKSLIRKRG